MRIHNLFITAIVACVMVLPAHAEDWQVVVESSEGVTLTADLDSISVYASSSQTDVVYVEAVMMYTSTKEVMPKFKARIVGKECVMDKKGTLVDTFSDGSQKAYNWDMSGRKMFDAQGQFLCGYTAEAFKMYQRNIVPISKKVWM